MSKKLPFHKKRNLIFILQNSVLKEKEPALIEQVSNFIEHGFDYFTSRCLSLNIVHELNTSK